MPSIREIPSGRGSVFALAAVLCAMVFIACACVPELVREIATPDIKPPSLVSWESGESGAFSLRFDETVTAEPADFSFEPGIGAIGVESDGAGTIVIRPGDTQEPGKAYVLSGAVRDSSGNVLGFGIPFWGFNPELPAMVINELLTEGSQTHPDAAEIRVLESGNIAGAALAVGALPEPSLRFVFPACRVEAGEFIVVHWKPQGIPSEVDETQARDDTGASSASAGIDATPSGRDFWHRGGDGALPGKNGALSLYRSPGGGLLDARYSERASDSDANYRGFGSAILREWVETIFAEGAWEADGEAVRPEDCVRSKATTSTRTMCRSSDSADTDSPVDWHIVPTKGASWASPIPTPSTCPRDP